WSKFYVHFGNANWAQFCPGNKNGNSRWRVSCDFVGTRLSFFVIKMQRTAGSLTSTYRVVRNTTLRAESEIKRLSQDGQRVSVIKESQSGDCRTEQIDQATKSASWMPWCQ